MWGGPSLTWVFFTIDFDRPFTRLDAWDGTQRLSGVTAHARPIPPGRTLLMFDREELKKKLFTFHPEEQAGFSATYDVKAGDVLQVKIGVSLTSIANARNNLEQECPHWDFDRVRRDAHDDWNRWLGRIQVSGGTDDQKTKFYTDLWHVLLGRHKIDDVSGDYPTYFDGSKRNSKGPLIVRTVPKDADGRPRHHMYNSDALWLTMWNLNVLWGLGWPEQLDEFSQCLMEYAKHGGWLPRGPCFGSYTSIMSGCPATSLITSAFQKGLLKHVDPEQAFAQMKKDHLPGGMMGASAFYDQNGWEPDRVGAPLQWAFEDWALAQMAAKLGKHEDYAHFMRRSAGWPAYYSPAHGLLMPKDKDGKWVHDNPLSRVGWVEANAWQGTFSVSHDLPKLAELMGGKDKLVDKLNFAFEQAAPTDFIFGYGNGYVSYANQPGCSNAHVFNMVGYPWLSQYWVRRVQDQAYSGITPNTGYGGHDEDQGQMGGISALMAMGVFSIRGTCEQEPTYQITAPIFDRVTITLDQRYYPGKEFVIITHDNSKENVYIQRAQLNGMALDSCDFRHQDFAQGGTLELWLGPQPNKARGLASIPGK
jgi:predicted alpha-1,2-mannosidase